MPRWTPDPNEWTGADVFVIGGGPSLQGFDWGLLEGRKTIGCNSAFRLGPRRCSLCFFSDIHWFETYENELAAYGGRVVTHAEEFLGNRVPWVFCMQRAPSGLHRTSLGFGGNSGCSAINLALLMGAARVFLLGFDCKLGKDRKPNWHEHVIDTPSDEVYLRFLEGFRDIANDLPSVFPGREVINLTPGSALTYFPTATYEEIFK
jgi:uncharacterized Rossmann fold enzyme